MNGKRKVTAVLAGATMLCGSLLGCSGVGESDGAAEYTWGNVAIGGGGYVTGMEYNPTEEGLVYARTDIGGLYRRQKDTNWVAITDFLGADEWGYIGIESMATDPVEPNRVYFAGGTYMSDPAALFASDDYGETWTRFDVPFNCGGNQSGRGCGERMCVNPNNNREVWFGTRSDGLWKTENYGESWEQVTSFPVQGNYKQEGNSIGIMWVTFDPASTDMYVGVAMTDGNCIYRTSDGGESWTALPTNAMGMYPLHASFSSEGVLYLAYSDNCGPNLSPTAGAVYRYDPAADQFTDITPNLNDGRQGGFGGISVDAQDPNRVVVSTLGWWSDAGDNLYYSTDGGNTWGGLFPEIDASDAAPLYQMDTSEAAWLDWGRGENQAKTGWWVADVNINPFNSDEVMYGTGATIYTTRNMTQLGTEPVTIAFDAYGLEETAVFEIISPPAQEGAPELYSIMGDLTGFAHEDVTKCPDDAHFMKNGKPTDIDCAFLAPQYAVYASEEKTTTLSYTKDGGATWETVAHKPDPAAGGEVAMSADGSTFIWVPDSISGTPYVTHDFGETWYYVEGLGYNAKIAADRVNPEVFYATCDGLFYVSTDGGVHFESTGQLVSDSAIPVAVFGKEGHVWLSSSTMLMYTEDGGANFTVVKSLPTVDSIGFGKAKDEDSYPVLYAEGDDGEHGYGIYKSEDKGESWVRINDYQHQFGNLNPKFITGDSNVYGRVYFCTDGRGIVMGELKQ